jgi:citrate lyase subunit beta/citryl-CoA lyase
MSYDPNYAAMVEKAATVLLYAHDLAHLSAQATESAKQTVLGAQIAVDSRLDAFVVGLNDLRKATGIPVDPGRTYLVPYLMQVVLAARAYGLDVVDSVSNDFRDMEAFSDECAQGKAMGFDGKMLIHPAQIEPTNRHFGPSDAAIAEARLVADAFSDPAHAGLNVINIDGRMIERLHAEEAARLLAKVDLITARKDKP